MYLGITFEALSKEEQLKAFGAMGDSVTYIKEHEPDLDEDEQETLAEVFACNLAREGIAKEDRKEALIDLHIRWAEGETDDESEEDEED